ncbi:MAG: bifunctional diguanylate cyclase/phosphodiesterase [Gammaproteobacteria bacterium]|nr:bifunctional diguanylate cyclase/phosphodiesterase [Gammaproteobacteria bacterium]
MSEKKPITLLAVLESTAAADKLQQIIAKHPEISLEATVTKNIQQMADVIAKCSAAEQVSDNQLSLYDSLTGLANQQSLLHQLHDYLEISQQQNTQFSVIFINIRNVELVNAQFGYINGDMYIKAIANHLEKIGIEDAFIARYSGGSFAVIVNFTGKEALQIILERIQGELVKPVVIASRQQIPVINMGVVICADSAGTPEKIIDNAYRAMLQASSVGLNAYAFSSNASLGSRMVRILEDDLQRSLEHDEFRLVYQPVIDAVSRKFISAEVLIRWHNDRFGDVAPEFFIPIAEDVDLIEPIGAWVIRESCRSLRQWLEAGLVAENFYLSINVSFKQLRHHSFYEMLLKTVKEYNIPPKLIQLELTETALIENVQQGLHDLQKLQDLGFTIAIDDFGTGYSSLNYISQMPVDIIKIDRSFIDHSEDKSTQTVIKSIIELGHSLNLKVVAEGVDSAPRGDWLQAQGCDYLQGFYFSKPVSENLFLELLKKST